MVTDIDLNLLPLYRLQGQEMPQIPGLAACMPPKRAGRARKDDRLLVYLSLSGSATLTPDEYSQTLEQLTQRFYQTSGSLTAAIRSAAGELNQSLLKRNLQTTSKGELVVGRLIMGVLRGNTFLFAQSGPMHIIHQTGGETRQVQDEQTAGRGLGVSQTMPLYFAQIDLRAGDVLMISPHMPGGWEAALTVEKNAAPETLRRVLAGISNEDLSVVLVMAQQGKGNLNLLKGTQSATEKPAMAVVTKLSEAQTGTGQGLPGRISEQASAFSDLQPSSTASGAHPNAAVLPSSQVQSARPANRFTHILSEEEKTAPAPVTEDGEIPTQNAGTSMAPSGQSAQEAAETPFFRPALMPVAPAAHPVRRSGHFVSQHSVSDIPEIKRPTSRRRQAIFGGLVKIIRGVRGGSQSVSKGIRKFTPTVLPNSNDGSEDAGPSMALLAIVIPVIIVAIAATVYIHYGRTAQYQQYYVMALDQASQARGQTSPTEVRRAWDSTIYYLDLAEKNQKTQDSTALRQEAQTALDNLDGILRLNFSQAILGGLSRSVQISHMASTDTDLYLLDAASGGVIRASITSQGYEVDTNFKCNPGQYGSIVVDALIDLEVLPLSNFYNARVVAMDGKGNLLYCGLAEPQAVSPVPPQLGWRSIAAFSLDADGKNLYVLDPAGNAVWQYSGSFGKFPDLPSLFFGEQVPLNMNTAIDLAANNADLYLLFQDGHVTSCPLSHFNVAPLRCTDPVTFVDTRPERQSGPKINDAIFTEMTFASAPDPSLYMLEPLTRAIYRFSPRADSLELRGQFRATVEQNNSLFEGPATAITISPNRYAFFSVGNQVFFSTDVP